MKSPFPRWPVKQAEHGLIVNDPNLLMIFCILLSAYVEMNLNMLHKSHWIQLFFNVIVPLILLSVFLFMCDFTEPGDSLQQTNFPWRFCKWYKRTKGRNRKRLVTGFVLSSWISKQQLLRICSDYKNLWRSKYSTLDKICLFIFMSSFFQSIESNV